MSIIKLKSSDNEIFDTDVRVAKCSGIIKTMLEDCCEADDDNAVVPLANVNSDILRKILEWANHHKDDPQPPKDHETKEKPIDDISSWDANFLQVDQGTLFELIKAANYLDIKGLLNLACRTVANMCEGKTTKQIREFFNIEDDLHLPEEEQISWENQCCEENLRGDWN